MLLVLPREFKSLCIGVSYCLHFCTEILLPQCHFLSLFILFESSALKDSRRLHWCCSLLDGWISYCCSRMASQMLPLYTTVNSLGWLEKLTHKTFNSGASSSGSNHGLGTEFFLNKTWNDMLNGMKREWSLRLNEVRRSDPGKTSP